MVAKYGEPGSTIPGSKYVREFCCYCGAAVRVSPRRHGVSCERCERLREGSTTEGPYRRQGRSGAAYLAGDIDADGWYSNARKAYENRMS